MGFEQKKSRLNAAVNEGRVGVWGLKGMSTWVSGGVVEREDRGAVSPLWCYY